MAAHSPRSAPATILLVEDDELLRDVLTEVLEAEGFRVIPASRPVEALTLCNQNEGSIDLLVSDVVMPGMSGVELASRLRTMRGDLQVLLISGYSQEIIEQKCTFDARDESLAKPFSIDAFLAHVHGLMRRRVSARASHRVVHEFDEIEADVHSPPHLVSIAG